MQLITMREVQALVPVTRPTIYALMRREGFPGPVKVGRKSFWVKAEVEGWVVERAEVRA